MNILERLRSSREWLNGGECCGDKDSEGICAAPACIFGEALKELYAAADEIERLRKNFSAAEHEMKIADRNRIFFQKEYERWMSMAQEMNAYSVRLETAIYNYVVTVMSHEGVTFIDGVDDEWAKLICDVWTEQHKKMEDKDE